ncbi:hypothetical protein EDEG_03086 [Edhazardia aedis USNM 41457]|uniref:Uncharacterized protein n=1 Tax=Edhazardia aedis (strain USNM 41457) TaxID=1003232 RepID=J9DIR4_EDHAE|nr:hypothetical protein EDEG_03086 [Edhazardia aedis USNM 41457]|eukprot:EJW02500.1 hypothetical protein EDEG_03086 [Edhazardia aedis USNM 41457]
MPEKMKKLEKRDRSNRNLTNHIMNIKKKIRIKFFKKIKIGSVDHSMIHSVVKRGMDKRSLKINGLRILGLPYCKEDWLEFDFFCFLYSSYVFVCLFVHTTKF